MDTTEQDEVGSRLPHPSLPGHCAHSKMLTDACDACVCVAELRVQERGYYAGRNAGLWP